MQAKQLLSTWKTFSSAPHRLFFWGGAGFAVVSIAIWTAQQASLYTPLLTPFGWSIPYPQAHAFLMIYCLFGFYFFGFLLTTFPRWLDSEPVPRKLYLPAWLLLFGGAHGFWAGLFVGKALVFTAGLAVFAGYALALAACLRILLRPGVRGRLQQILISAGLCAGTAGIALFCWAVAGGGAPFFSAARLTGIYLFLLPVIFTVVYRMVPFFTSTVTEQYQLRRSPFAPLLFAALLVLRAALGFLAMPEWTWLADGALLIVLTREALLWRFWRAPALPLLMILYAGVAWIWLSFALSTAESLYVLATGAVGHPFGNASLHALTVGGFGSLLIGISTRVTLGHSGGGLATGRLTTLLFLLFQIVPVMRVFPEVLGFWWPEWRLQGFWAGILWVILFGAWFLGIGPILMRPRSDGRSG